MLDDFINTAKQDMEREVLCIYRNSKEGKPSLPDMYWIHTVSVFRDNNKPSICGEKIHGGIGFSNYSYIEGVETMTLEEAQEILDENRFPADRQHAGLSQISAVVSGNPECVLSLQG